MAHRMTAAATAGALCLGLLAGVGLDRAFDSGAEDGPPQPSLGAGDCGQVAFFQMVTEPDAPEFECMRAALAEHRIATLRMESQTVEGAPTPQIYWLAADGTLSVTSDSRRDTSGGGITYSPCVRQPWLDSTRCRRRH